MKRLSECVNEVLEELVTREAQATAARAALASKASNDDEGAA